MPNWHEIGEELKRAGSSFDVIRRGYIHSLSSYTGRNTYILLWLVTKREY